MTRPTRFRPSRTRPAAKRTPKRPAGRPGVPVWRVGKPDAFLADAVGPAREAVRTIAADAAIGAHLGARSEGERVVTHLFECTMSGYSGWTWFAVLARVSRAKTVTVNEVGLLPTEDSVLAPEWVPWAARVRPEDAEAWRRPRRRPAPKRRCRRPMPASPAPASRTPTPSMTLPTAS